MNGCKNCPAYKKCTIRPVGYRGSTCAALRFTCGLDSDPEIVTNFERHFKTPEAAAHILYPLMPTMEGFCYACRHWKDNACEVNPKWDCENGMLDWLNSKTEEAQ